MYKIFIVLLITLIMNINLVHNTVYAGGYNSYAGAAVAGTVVGVTVANQSVDVSFNMDLKYCIAHIFNKNGSVIVEGVVQKSEGKNGFVVVTISDKEYIATLSNAQFDITKENIKYRAEQKRFHGALGCAMITGMILLTFTGMALSHASVLNILSAFSIIGIFSFLIFCLTY